jgi:hypothetical protein
MARLAQPLQVRSLERQVWSIFSRDDVVDVVRRLSPASAADRFFAQHL